jgi:hypothetical protein
MNQNSFETAFPSSPTAIGLTKREYFAAMAMQGLLAHGFYHYDDKINLAIRMSEVATISADFMLKTLERDDLKIL